MTLDDYLPFAPVLLTGLFAFFGTWAGSRFSHVNEHSQWLRNEKMAVCSDFVSKTAVLTSTKLQDASATDLETFTRGVSELNPAKMKLICSIEVVEAGLKLEAALKDLASAARAALVAESDQQADLKRRVSEAIAVVEHHQGYFILESSSAINSGRFYGMGLLRSTLMPILRLRRKVEEHRMASPNLG